MADAKPERKLTPRQRMFVQEYLVDLNATQACIRAGYSPKTAGAMSVKLVSKGFISAAIQKQMDKRAKKTEVTAEYIINTIQETVERARADDDRPSIFKGTELLGKHLKLFTDKIEHTGQVGLIGDFKINFVKPDRVAGTGAAE